MTSKWETRERSTKRFALIMAIVLHILAFTVISISTSKLSVRDLIEPVFGQAQPLDQATADARS